MSKQAIPKLAIPDTITLPDGRTVEVKPLLRQVRQRINYNLRKTRKGVRVPDYTAGKRTTPLKYTVEERIWMAQADIETIAAKYSISLVKAQGLKYHSKYILEKLDVDLINKE